MQHDKKNNKGQSFLKLADITSKEVWPIDGPSNTGCGGYGK